MANSVDRYIPLFDIRVSPEAHREMRRTLADGWLTAGPRVERFEKHLARMLGVRHTAALNSGSAGLLLTLRAMGAARGKEVITSPFTYVATFEAIVQAGATPVAADIQPDTLNIDPREVERLMTRNCLAVLPVDMAGYPSDYRELRQVCSANSAALIADSAHAFGATYRGRTMAQLADAAVYSFYSTKNLSCGEGGLVASRKRGIVENVRALSCHGLTSTTVARRKRSGRRYDVSQVGYKATMSDIHAAIGLGQLERFERDQDKRRRLARRYFRNLDYYPELLSLPPITDDREHSWHMFIVRLNLDALTIDRDRVLSLMSDAGVECGVHFRPIFEMTVYRRMLSLKPRDYPHADQAGRKVLTLPLYPLLRMRDVDYISERLIDILTAHQR